MRKIKYFLVPFVAILFVLAASPANAADVTGTNGPDTIAAPQTGPDQDHVIAKAGDDTVLSYGAADWLQLGHGNDTARAGTGYDYVHGGEGNDTLQGNADPDDLLGNWGRDTLRGGNGVDELWPGPSRDNAYGGEGNDVFYVGVDDAVDNIQCGDGDDWVVYNDAVDTEDVLGDCENVTGTV